MPKFVKKVSIGVAGLAALALGGSALAGAAGSSSSSTTTTPGASGSGTSTAPNARGRSGPPPGFPAGKEPGAAAHEAAEKPVTGASADKAKAAALKAVAGKACDQSILVPGGEIG